MATKKNSSPARSSSQTRTQRKSTQGGTSKKRAAAPAPAQSRKKTAASAVPAKRPVRREIWSVVCLFLAIFAVLCFFDIDALFINVFRSLMRGLLGWGSYMLPLLLLCASWMLAFHRGRPVRLRVFCCLAIAVAAGSFAQLFGKNAPWAASWAIFPALYLNDGVGGGVIGGLAAIALEYIFSNIGAAIILIVGTCLLIFAAFRAQIISLVTYLMNRERPRYEPQPEPVREPILKPVPVEKREEPVRVAKKRVYDIPVDNEPTNEPKPAEESPESKRNRSGSLLRKRADDIRTPDEVLRPDQDMPAEVKPLIPPEDEIEDDTPFVIGADGLPEGGVDAPPAPPSTDDETAEPAEITVEHGTADAEEAPAEEPEAEPVEEDIAGAAARALETAAVSGYAYPPLELLEEAQRGAGDDGSNEMKTNAVRLIDTIKSFGIEVKLVNVTRGPSVTRYELEMDRGVKLTKLTGLSEDIALSLGASGVRIAPIPDKVAVVGVEVPNKAVSTVYLREIIGSREFQGSKSKVAFAVGRDIGGDAIVSDISRLPHLLIAGTTGSGKSVCMNSLIISLLYKARPEDVRLIMVDPKMIELNIYNGIPHLLIPVVTDPKKASGALQWAVSEMMKRYKAFAEHNVRDFASYNAYAERSGGELEKMPQIVILIDELADLMLVAAKEVEESICRIAQMARAAGMHLVIATQSPRADVITGIMKANIPSRIAFAVASQLESRIIMDTSGAEKLVGKGDMLYFPLGNGKPTRVQGCYISSAEVERVVEFVKNSGTPEYSEEVLNQIEKNAASTSSGDKGHAESELDDMFVPAVEVILEVGQASTSMLQRRLKLGYARAARLVDQLEAQGILGPFEGAKPRDILITREQWEEMKLQNPAYQ